MSFMKKKKSKKIQPNSNKKNEAIVQTKNSSKLVLFIFGIGPIIGILIFLYSKGFFNSPNMWILNVDYLTLKIKFNENIKITNDIFLMKIF